jgi:ATP-dependent DNA helicase PIF1
MPSIDQARFVKAARNGESVLLVGAAGTGKSACLRLLGSDVSMTAMTGVASTCIPGACTLHKFLNVFPAEKESFSAMWESMKRSEHTITKLRSLKTLVVDEISMAHGRFVLILDLLLRKARGVLNKPFGGVQMIFVGDFLQIPPVTKKDDPWGPLYAFQVFDMIGFKPRRIDLLTVFRQDDPSFLTCMKEARHGRLTDKSLSFLRKCEKTVFPNDGVLPTMIFNTNREVNAENERCMMETPNTGKTTRVTFQCHWFFAEQSFDLSKQRKVYIFRNKPILRTQAASRVQSYLSDIEPSMEVRAGMQVLFRWNFSPELMSVANGTRGVVCGWVEHQENNMGTTLVPIDKDSVAMHCQEDPTVFGLPVPVVYIATTDRHFLVYPHTAYVPWIRTKSSHHSQDDLCLVLVVRRLPFVAGWALTAHRVQGMTLDRIQISMGRGFSPPATMYVRFSRVRGPSGLKVVGELQKRHFWANPLAVEHFGENASKLHSGSIWKGPTLDVAHYACGVYTGWKTVLANSVGEPLTFKKRKFKQ